MADARRDNNLVVTLLGTSNADGITPVVLWADPVTHRLLVSAASASHSILSASHDDSVVGTVVLGDIIIGNSTPKWERLAGNITTTKKFLIQTGNGTISAAPVWGTIIAADLPDLSATYALTGHNHSGVYAPVLGADDNYVTDTEKAALHPQETATTIGALIGGADNATPNDTDFVATSLTAAGILKKITWTNVKAFLKTYFDTLYAAALGVNDNYVTDAEKTALHGVNDANTSSATSAQGATADAALPKAGGTMTGKIVKAGTTEVGKTYAPATGAQTVALDCAVNNIHIVSGHADGTAITFTVANATSSQPFIVSILQGAVVSTITAWFATIRWSSGTVPTLTATANKRDTFGFIRTSADTYDGFVIGQNC